MLILWETGCFLGIKKKRMTSSTPNFLRRQIEIKLHIPLYPRLDYFPSFYIEPICFGFISPSRTRARTTLPLTLSVWQTLNSHNRSERASDFLSSLWNHDWIRSGTPLLACSLVVIGHLLWITNIVWVHNPSPNGKKSIIKKRASWGRTWKSE